MSRNKQPEWLKREIQYFNKTDDSFAGQDDLAPIELSILQNYFEVDQDDPIFDMYQIEPVDATFLKPYTSLEFDFEIYDYWLAAYTDNWEQTKLEKGFMGQYPPPKQQIPNN
ncbi:hypothetical protein SNE25_28530 [Mucilaginibacter sabulilitoris]|uniref:DUF7683 domain-containing protein n=1 Tax=Mucilaginibacter sabulilitoris TaxID=1173583 RepID=A0ABZ0TKE9_9SPHI|nr:hypothetical protein [Mucilaginibacter sabulilitoris]WPU93271.1 hypothetical protein SNE25_28530 [Mucilaginibacter sabulilitoris]